MEVHERAVQPLCIQSAMFFKYQQMTRCSSTFVLVPAILADQVPSTMCCNPYTRYLVHDLSYDNDQLRFAVWVNRSKIVDIHRISPLAFAEARDIWALSVQEIF